MAEASMLGGVIQQPIQRSPMTRTMPVRRQTQAQFGGGRAFAGGSPSYAFDDRLHRPALYSRNLNNTGGMRAFDSPQFVQQSNVRSQFAGASTQRTLDERFGGGSRVRVANNTNERQFYF